MVKWLVTNRRGNHWKSTKDTATAVLGLADYLRLSRELSSDYVVRLTLEGAVTKEVRINRENTFTFDNQLVLAGDAVMGGKRKLIIEKIGKGNLYYSVHLKYFTREEDIKAAGNMIFPKRFYSRLIEKTRDVKRTVWVDRKPVERLVKEVYYERVPLKPGEELVAGDEIEVTIDVTAQNDLEYLVFEDPKPAGCEPLRLRSGYAWGRYADNLELRDEKVVFFCSRLPRGTHRFSYKLRAEIPGHFHTMPCKGYAMYLPEVRGTSDEARIIIREE